MYGQNIASKDNATTAINPQGERQATLLIVANSMDFFSSGFREVIVPLYLYSSGLSAVTVGIYYTINYLVSTLLRTQFSMIADSYGKKPMIIAGMILYGLSGVVLSVPATMFTAYLAGTVNGLSGGVTSSSISSTIAEKASTPERRDHLFARSSSLTTLTTAFGALAATVPAVLASAHMTTLLMGYRYLFMLQSGIAAIAVLTVLFGLSEEVHAEARTFREVFRLPRQSLPTVLRLSVQGAVGLGAGIALPLLPIWLSLRFHASLADISLLYFVSRIALGSSVLLAPRVSKIKGRVFTISFSQFVSGVFFLLIPLSPNLLVAFILLIARSVTSNFNDPILRSFIANTVHPKERTTAFNLVQTVDSVPR
ncbi:MAG: MFS transporter [Candidatus Bathyarchaeia archaeon]